MKKIILISLIVLAMPMAAGAAGDGLSVIGSGIKPKTQNLKPAPAWPLKAIEYPAGASVCTGSGLSVMGSKTQNPKPKTHCMVATVPFVVMPKTQAVRIANALPDVSPHPAWYEKPEIWLAAGALVAAIFGVVLEVK